MSVKQIGGIGSVIEIKNADNGELTTAKITKMGPAPFITVRKAKAKKDTQILISDVVNIITKDYNDN